MPRSSIGTGLALALLLPALALAQVPSAAPPGPISLAPSLRFDLAASTLVQPGVLVHDLTVGHGQPALLAGHHVTVRLRAWLPDATPLATGSADSVTFQFGSGVMLPSFEAALVGMAPGGRRQILLAADQAYGSDGGAAIPKDSPLVLEVTLLTVN